MDHLEEIFDEIQDKDDNHDSPECLLQVQPVTDSENDQELAECLLLSQPVRDPYSSTGSLKDCHGNIKRQAENHFVQNDDISPSNLTAPELIYFLGFEFSKIDPEVNTSTAKIEQLVAQCFQFTFPGGPPECCISKLCYTDAAKQEQNTSWENLAKIMCAGFFNKAEHEWLRNNYFLDYTVTTQIEFVKQRDVIAAGLRQEDDHLLNAASLANQIHFLFQYLIQEERKIVRGPDAKRDSREKGDLVRNLMCSLAGYLNIPIKLKGCQYDMYYPVVPDRPLGGVNIKVKPDLTLCVETPRGAYPFCVIQVHHSEDRSTKQNTGEHGNKCDLNQETAPNTENRLEIKKANSQHNNKQTSFYNSHKLISNLQKIVCSVSPVVASDTSAFQKYTAKLPMELYGSLVQQENIRKNARGTKEKWFANSPGQKCEAVVKKCEKNQQNCDETVKQKVDLQKCEAIQRKCEDIEQKCEAVGLFIDNEFIYLQKISQLYSYIDSLASHEGIIDVITEGPKVHFADWCLNIKKPNHRLALLTFLFYYKKIVLWEAAS